MDPQDLINKLLGVEMTPNDYVERNFPRSMHWDDFLRDSPMSTNIIDRRYSTDDPAASPQDYIERAFQELNDPSVR
jgi:hypothetical protein